MRIVPSTRLVVAVCLERQWLREAIVFPLVPRFEVDSGCLCTALMLCRERATAEFPWSFRTLLFQRTPRTQCCLALPSHRQIWRSES